MSTIIRHFDIDTEAFAACLAKDGIKTLALVRNPRRPDTYLASDSRYDWAASALTAIPDFDQHEAVFLGPDPVSGGLFISAVHNSHRGPALGGCREETYRTVMEALTDVLRLSKGMTRKNAISGIWYGGGKGVLARVKGADYTDRSWRDRVYRSWGAFVAAQFGYYITAEDMNNTVEDTRQMLAANRYTACTPEDVGGSGNPSPVTAEGVVHAMRAAVLRVLGKGSLFGLRINVQGVGNVGLHLVRLLVRDGALIRACDKNAQAMDQVKAEFPEVEIVSPDKIFDLPGDIFAPCARGAVLNPETIARLKVKMVCGAANNTLAEEDRDGQSLAARGIVDCVDYNCNRGGVINAAQELVCRNPERVRQRVAKAYGDTLTILEEAERKGLAPYVVANALADSRAAEDHPLEGYIGEIHIARYVAMRKSREKKAA